MTRSELPEPMHSSRVGLEARTRNCPRDALYQPEARVWTDVPLEEGSRWYKVRGEGIYKLSG